MGSFADSLRQNITRVQTEVNFKVSQVAYKLFSYAINRSPGGLSCTIGPGPFVDGDFINNWFPAINSYDSSTTSGKDITGAGSLARLDLIKTGNAFFSKDGFVTLSNNISYGSRVEFGWPAGVDPVSGWKWTGRALIYAPLQYSMQDIKADI